MFKRMVIISAAVIGSTFVSALPVLAEPVVIQSQPDHDSRNRATGNASSAPGPDATFVENLMLQVRVLQQEMAEQRGIIEELNYELQILQQEQKERYVDLDQRLLGMQQRITTQGVTPGEGVVSTTVSDSAISDEQILAEYNAARELIRERDFPGAVVALSDFSVAHPNHELAPNAWYWLGEVHLVNGDVEQARAAFATVVENHEGNAKVPDSLYKMGVIAQQQQQAALARDLFERVVNEFPGSQSAKLSQARLNSN